MSATAHKYLKEHLFKYCPNKSNISDKELVIEITALLERFKISSNHLNEIIHILETYKNYSSKQKLYFPQLKEIYFNETYYNLRDLILLIQQYENEEIIIDEIKFKSFKNDGYVPKGFHVNKHNYKDPQNTFIKIQSGAIIEILLRDLSTKLYEEYKINITDRLYSHKELSKKLPDLYTILYDCVNTFFEYLQKETSLKGTNDQYTCIGYLLLSVDLITIPSDKQLNNLSYKSGAKSKKSPQDKWLQQNVKSIHSRK